jgi:menaquinone-9 beta-reductase
MARPEWDVVIVGAGPAGSVAATVLAREGLKILLLDRARFPRAKLCGDTLNPGALADLRRLGLAAYPETHGEPIEGMVVTGVHTRIEARYARGLLGRAIERTELDWWLVECARNAGADFRGGARVSLPLTRTTGGQKKISGVVLKSGSGATVPVASALTIAADGRRSTIAFSLGLARHPAAYRRWAIGAYFEGVDQIASTGEMHIRPRHYLGIAKLPGGKVNAVAVATRAVLEGSISEPGLLLRGLIDGDPMLAPRFRQARIATKPVVLGPLAVDADKCGMPGLLLAGDAAGFIDPITGDGLRFAIRGGELAARAALMYLSGSVPDPHEWLFRARARDFSSKWRVNRIVRTLVGSPRAVRVASVAARLTPVLIRRLIDVAGDVKVHER